MPSITHIAQNQYLVKHAGRVQGPFPAHFITAMVQAGIYSTAIPTQRTGYAHWTPYASFDFGADLDNSLKVRPQSSDPKAASHSTPFNHKKLACVLLGIFLLSVWIANQSPAGKSNAAPVATTAASSQPSPASSYSSSSSSYTSEGSSFSAAREIGPAPEDRSSFKAPTTTYRPTEPSSYKSYDPGTASTPLPPPAYPPSVSQQPSYYHPPSTHSVTDASGRTYRVSEVFYADLVTMQTALELKKQKLEEAKADLLAADQKLAKTLRLVDKTDSREVASYNKGVRQLDAMQEKLQLLLDDYNSDVDAYNTKLARVGTPID